MVGGKCIGARLRPRSIDDLKAVGTQTLEGNRVGVMPRFDKKHHIDRHSATNFEQVIQLSKIAYPYGAIYEYINRLQYYSLLLEKLIVICSQKERVKSPEKDTKQKIGAQNVDFKIKNINMDSGIKRNDGRISRGSTYNFGI